MIRLLRVTDLDLEGVLVTLARPHMEAARDVAAQVAAIVDEVRHEGDAAVLELSKRFDGVALEPVELEEGH